LGFERYGLVVTVLLAVWCSLQIMAVGSLVDLVLVQFGWCELASGPSLFLLGLGLPVSL